MDINFEKLPESKEIKYVKTAGIHIGYELSEKAFASRTSKDGKPVNGSLKLTLKNNESGEVFMAMIFQPPSKAEDILFFGDVYENGVKVRQRNVEEEIKAQFEGLFYFYEQLAKAIQAPLEKLTSFRKSITGRKPEELWEHMFNTFFTLFPEESFKGKKIDFKALWNNSDKKKTSFLGLGNASAGNMVFATTIATSDRPKSSVLDIMSSEQKKLTRKFSPQDRAPQGNQTEIAKTDTAWTPESGTEAPTQIGDLQANANGEFF